MRFRNIFLAFAYFSLGACSGHEIDLVQTGAFPVELTITEGFMASTIATEEDGQLKVSGRVIRTDHKRRYIKGSVEIKVIGINGKVLESAKVDYTPWASRRTRSKSTFEVKFKSLPPPGAKLLLEHVVLTPTE